MAVELRALRADDDRSSFRSDDEALDLFFHRYAGQNQCKHHIGVTYVAVDGARILGFATVSPGTLEVDALPQGRRVPRYPAPILRLGRLAVARDAQRRGVGGALLRFVLTLAVRPRDELGCVGVVVDAKPGAVGYCAQYGFAVMRALEGESLARPAPAMMFLPIGSIPTSK